MFDIPERQTYQDHQRELANEQSSMSREEIASLMASESEAVFDPETATKPQHRWVDRGLKMSCEGAGHAMHQSWKIRPQTVR